MMTKEKIAEALEEIATLLELKDENPFKIRAYQNAARSIEAFGAGFSDLQNQETLEKIPGIGKAIAAKISELATTGELKFLDELRAEFPSAILELFSIPGLGAKKIRVFGRHKVWDEPCCSDRGVDRMAPRNTNKDALSANPASIWKTFTSAPSIAAKASAKPSSARSPNSPSSAAANA